MRSGPQERSEAPGHRFFVPLDLDSEVVRDRLFEQRLFVMRVLEKVSWNELWEIPLDEFEFLHRKAVEINEKLAEEVDEIRKNSHR